MYARTDRQEPIHRRPSDSIAAVRLHSAPSHPKPHGPHMNPTVTPDWEGIRHAWETTHRSVADIAAAFQVHSLAIWGRSRRRHWPPRPRTESPPEPVSSLGEGLLDLPPCGTPVDLPAAPPPAPPPVRSYKTRSVLARRGDVQGIINGISATIVKRLVGLEAQVDRLADMDTQDAERFDRSMRITMQNFEKVRSLDAGNKRKSRNTPAAAATEPTGKSGIVAPVSAAALDAERGELAERIRRLHAQWLVRRSADATDGAGSPSADPSAGPRLADGGAARAAAAAPD